MSDDDQPMTFNGLILLVAAGIASLSFIVAVAYFAIQTVSTNTVVTNQQYAELSSPRPAAGLATAEVRHFVITVANDTITTGLPINVHYGDRVFIDIHVGTQDEADIQIPDFLQSTTVEQGGTDAFEFVANKRGSFDVFIKRMEPWEGETFNRPMGKFNVL